MSRRHIREYAKRKRVEKIIIDIEINTLNALEIDTTNFSPGQVPTVNKFFYLTWRHGFDSDTKWNVVDRNTKQNVHCVLNHNQRDV